MRAGPQCETRRAELVPRAGLDSPACSFCRLVHADEALAFQVHADCEPIAAIRTVAWFVLPPGARDLLPAAPRRLPPAAAVSARLPRGARSPRAAARSRSSTRARGRIVYVPVEMDGSLGRVVFEAAHRDPAARVFWHLDDEYQGETRDRHQLALAPRPGAHRLVLVDERGETVDSALHGGGPRQPRICYASRRACSSAG